MNVIIIRIMSCLNRVNRIFQLQIKSHLKNGVTLVTLSRDFSQRTDSVKYSSQNVDQRSVAEGPIAVLQKKITNGELKVDEHQNKVMAELQQLYNTIQTYTPAEIQAESPLFKWLPIKKSPKKSKNKTPKGLYIHGAVGGGKTTLMDLFYDSCQSVCNNLSK